MARANITKEYIVNGISRALIEYGYPDAKPPMISEIYDAYKAGKRDSDLPHGVVGRFAEAQLKEITQIIKDDLP